MANLTDRRASVDVTGNKTLTAADSGIVQNIVGDNITVTLPATASGLNFIVRAGGVLAGSTAGSVQDGAQHITVAPVAADGVTGLGYTAAVNKGAELGANAAAKKLVRIGDEIRVAGNGTTGATAWSVAHATGSWTRVA